MITLQRKCRCIFFSIVTLTLLYTLILGVIYTNEETHSGPKVIRYAKQYSSHQTIRECLCSRRFMYPLSPHANLKRLNSSCSDEATYYQPNQSVISMSMFLLAQPENQKHILPAYHVGLLLNLIKMRQYYPGYSLRIYTNNSLSPKSPWCKLLCENNDLFWCDVRSTPSDGDLSSMNPRTWRFLVVGDPTVQIFQSRDLDSLIGYREAAAVGDWLENVGYKDFQLMRDQKYFHNAPILAGLWGAQNSRLLVNGKATLLREKIIKSSQLIKNQGTKHWDQKLLSLLIVNDHGQDVVAYDSYHCKEWARKTMVRPFPTQRQVEDPARDFVGNSVNFTGDSKGKVFTFKEEDLRCPVECRPSHGKDWIYC